MATKTPDELVAELFRLQNEKRPDDDPGDLTIDVQDDSAATFVYQRGHIVGNGGSIQQALENALWTEQARGG